jgi:hypothetical protein
MGIKKLSRVIRVVPGLLQPDGQEILVESLLNEFWITPYRQSVSLDVETEEL